jgi:PLD-like domain
MQREGRVISGSELLALRPIESDLRGLFGRVKLDLEAETLGLFTQATFDAAVEADIANASESVVIFSGFVTPTRVAKLGDLLRLKTLQDVKVRCVTRPPHLNGSMEPIIGKEALDALENVGCIVDCRARIHEKVVIIDREIVWHGSLNVLSHTHRTDESMTRLVNACFARALAANMSKRHQSQEKALGAMAEAENPRCGGCGGRTVYNEGRFGPYFYCEGRCGWKINLKSFQCTYNSNSTGGRDDSMPRDGPQCPVCKGKTTVRSGPYGAFYSCVKYPACPGKAHVGDDGAKQAPRKDRKNSRPSALGTTQVLRSVPSLQS